MVDRAVIEKLLVHERPGIRVVPSIRDGKPAGLKFYAIRPGSLYAALGFLNGDTLTSVNELDLTTPDQALAVYETIKQASDITVTVRRQGSPVTLRYSIL